MSTQRVTDEMVRSVLRWVRNYHNRAEFAREHWG